MLTDAVDGVNRSRAFDDYPAKNSYTNTFLLYSGRPWALLHVEADDATAYLFQLGLQQSGMEARYYRTKTGTEAIDFVRGRGSYGEAPAPDVVVLDIDLPGMDGFDTLRKLKAICLEHVPLVILSSSANPDHRKRAVALGAHDYLVKGGRLEDFEQAARDACAHIIVPDRCFHPGSGVLRVHVEISTPKRNGGRPGTLSLASTNSEASHSL